MSYDTGWHDMQRQITFYHVPRQTYYNNSCSKLIRQRQTITNWFVWFLPGCWYSYRGVTSILHGSGSQTVRTGRWRRARTRRSYRRQKNTSVRISKLFSHILGACAGRCNHIRNKPFIFEILVTCPHMMNVCLLWLWLLLWL